MLELGVKKLLKMNDNKKELENLTEEAGLYEFRASFSFPQRPLRIAITSILRHS